MQTRPTLLILTGNFRIEFELCSAWPRFMNSLSKNATWNYIQISTCCAGRRAFAFNNFFLRFYFRNKSIRHVFRVRCDTSLTPCYFRWHMWKINAQRFLKFLLFMHSRDTAVPHASASAQFRLFACCCHGEQARTRVSCPVLVQAVTCQHAETCMTLPIQFNHCDLLNVSQMPNVVGSRRVKLNRLTAVVWW